MGRFVPTRPECHCSIMHGRSFPGGDSTEARVRVMRIPRREFRPQHYVIYVSCISRAYNSSAYRFACICHSQKRRSIVNIGGAHSSPPFPPSLPSPLFPFSPCLIFPSLPSSLPPLPLHTSWGSEGALEAPPVGPGARKCNLVNFELELASGGNIFGYLF